MVIQSYLKKIETLQMNNLTLHTTEIQRIVRNYYEQLYLMKFENQGEMDKFLEIYYLPKLNEEEAESLNRLIIADESEEIIKKISLHTKALDQMVSQNFAKYLRES